MTKDTFKQLLVFLNFEQHGNKFIKNFPLIDADLSVDFTKEHLGYPTDKGFKINEKQTTNFSAAENFVVFECVHRLFEKGYRAESIELEPKWKVGHGASGGRADILIKNQEGNELLLIECKLAGKEFDKAWKKTIENGDQLFSYAQQIPQTEYLCLYASDFDEKTQDLKTYQRIILHKDNPKILEQSEKELKSFGKARDLKERFLVWKDTYQLEYTEKGIFEENIQPYQIGKDKYTLAIDTRPIDSTDRKGKYHEFRTKLRKYNIARKETAFEVLVNLFLCKIVDEKEHKDDLHFYWKGIAFDNYFDFVDRLQKLYQIGMDRFLGEKITYISNEQIDSAFWTVKNKRNATKKTIQEYFRKLKFFTNSAFSFRDVHNEKIFIENSKILLEIVQMWQNLRLTTDTQNQFLGDMFEFFLDNSIKQSEGQFFTPVPICKFIVSSLPLENAVKEKAEPLKAIDYACGAGHFLNEYALQISPIVEKFKQTDIKEYYKNTYGIEKEDRLAKIAKVAAFMYGQDEIVIRDVDALDQHPNIEDESFDVLVANPPFAVEGFLETLPEEQRDKYELFSSKLNLSNSDIQCFFIERAKQLLAPNAIAGIIVPSSVLSNGDGLYPQTREILLKYFDIISMVELGNRTFGKTGTNTIVLFIRRKGLKPEPAEHYKNRVEDYFEGIKEGDKDLQEYQDLYLIRAYCQQIEVDYDEYKKLFNVTTETIGDLDKLFAYEIFKDYKTDFEQSTIIVNLKKSKTFKELKKAEQQKELNKRLIAYLQRIEKDKLYYFILAYNNPCKVLIVKSPGDNKEQKQFLGYEWSGAKGQEGIKYNGGEIVSDIITPMFDPKNPHNPDKISYYIQQNFIGNEITAPKDYLSYAKLIDLLDFSRKDFNKSFSLTPKKNLTIETKWELVKLENVMQIVRGASPRPISKYIITDDSKLKDGVNWIKIGDVSEGSKYITKTAEKITLEGAENSRFVNKGDFILSNSMSFGRPYIMKIEGCIHDGWLLMSKFSEKLDKDFLYEILSYKDTQQQFSESAAGGVVQNLNTERVKATKIPLPPLETQKLIVQECESVDAEVSKAQANIEKAKAEIEILLHSMSSDFSSNERNLGEIVSFKNGLNYTQDSRGESIKMIGVADFQDNFSPNLNLIENIQIDGNLSKDYELKAKDILIVRSNGSARLVGRTLFIDKIFEKTSFSGFTIRIRPLNEEINSKFLCYYLKTDSIRNKITKDSNGSNIKSISQNLLSTIKIPVPPLPIQEKLVAEITKLEKEIAEARKIIESSAERKQAIMKKYL